MTDEQKNKIEEKFKEGKYDIVSYIVDNDLVTINLGNYESFCDEILYIFNSIRINRSIVEEEMFYPYEELFANDFHRSIYRAIKRNEGIEEVSADVLDKLAYYYKLIKNIGSVSSVSYGEEKNNEKIK